MKLTFISDTHCTKPKLPSADVLIHCGDLTGMGTVNAFRQELDWFESLKPQFPEGIYFIPGNHDIGLDRSNIIARVEAFYKDPYHRYPPKWQLDDPVFIKKMYADAGVHIIIDQAFMLGDIPCYGSPMTPAFYGWAFGAKDQDLDLYWQMIPAATQLLITHGPPYRILDLCPNGHVGSESLAKALSKLPNLKLHAFGHIHESAGLMVHPGGRLSLNASVLDGNYNGFNPIYTIETRDWSYTVLKDETV